LFKASFISVVSANKLSISLFVEEILLERRFENSFEITLDRQ
jgi:hypothetical protein